MIRRMLEQLTDMVRLLLPKDPPTPSISWIDSQTEDDRRRGQSEVSAAQSGPFHSEIPKSQSTVVNETPKLQSVVVNSRQEIFGIPTNINSSLGVIFESQEWGGSIVEDSECESREVNLTPNSSCHDARGDSVTKVDGDRQSLYVSSMEDSCPSKTEDDLSEIDATIDTSIHEILPGRFVQVEKQSRLNAHHMFDEMPKGKVEAFQHSKVIFVPLVVSKMGCVDSEMVYDDNGDVFAHSIDLIRSRANDGESNSTDSPGLFVFDPGKRIRFLLHSGVIEALVIFVFDPGISCKV